MRVHVRKNTRKITLREMRTSLDIDVSDVGGVDIEGMCPYIPFSTTTIDRGGESYQDVVVRLEPVIMELERQENIIIICHQVSPGSVSAFFSPHADDKPPG